MDERRLLKLSPGDRVLFTNHYVYNLQDTSGYDLWASRGSIGRVLSLEEFQDFYKKLRHPHPYYNPKKVKEWMEKGEAFPIRLEYAAPYEDGKNDHPSYRLYANSCAVGEVTIFHPNANQMRIISEGIIEPVKKTDQPSQNRFRSAAWMVGVGLAVGALTVLGQATLPGSWNHFANSGAVWLVAAFVVGMWMPGVLWAVVGGFISLVMALAGYTAVISLLGLSYPLATIAFWGAIGLVGGPVFGLAGQWWRFASASWYRAASAALMGGVFIAEGWYMLTVIQDGLAGWVSIVIGGLLAVLLPRSRKDRVRSLAALIPITLLGIGAFALLARLTS